MKNTPIAEMNGSTANFTTVVTTWKVPMLRMPARLTAAGIDSPTRTSSTGSTGMVGVDEVLDIQDPADRDRRVASRRGDPVRPGVREPEAIAKATRAYAYGPPSAGRRRDRAANSSASTSAPTVVSAIETKVIGP